LSYLDIFFIVIFVIGAIKGYRKGFVVELFSFVGFFAGLFAAIELTIPIAQKFFINSDYFQLLTIAVFVVLFILVLIAITYLGIWLKKVIEVTFLGVFDNVLGALASILKWAFIFSVLIWVFDSIGVSLSKEIQEESMLYPIIEVIGPKGFHFLSQIMPFLKDMIDSLENISDKTKSVYTFL
jgi:membrane protein required for colicin V production